MAELVVRRIENEIKERLRRRARQHGRSMEEEVREILRAAVRTEDSGSERLGTRLARRFKGIGLREPLPELRSPLRMPLFEK